MATAVTCSGKSTADPWRFGSSHAGQRSPADQSPFGLAGELPVSCHVPAHRVAKAGQLLVSFCQSAPAPVPATSLVADGQAGLSLVTIRHIGP